ncbi:MAG: LPS translocon maturation chaperone LptM [Rhizomicrobium sp.]
MIRRILALGALVLVLAGCGVKSNLVMPDGKPTPKRQQDPSRPPSPLGQ